MYEDNFLNLFNYVWKKGAKYDEVKVISEVRKELKSLGYNSDKINDMISENKSYIRKKTKENVIKESKVYPENYRTYLDNIMNLTLDVLEKCT